MKNRILSFVLAVVMVLALVPATVLVSSAAQNDVTITVGNGTAVPGGVAYLSIFVSDEEVGDFEGACNLQVVFDLPEGVSIVKDKTLCSPYVTGAEASYFTNVEAKQYGVTADAGYFIATAEGLEARGGAYVSTVAFDVADTVAAGTELTVGIAKVEEYTYRVAPTTDTKYTATGSDLADIEFVSGKIIVGNEGDFAADEYEGAGEDYVVPAVNASGKVVTSLLNAEGDSVLTGEFGYITVPASVPTAEGVDYTDGIAGVIVKNPYDTTAAGAAAGMGTSKAPVDLYFHKSAGGVGLVEAGYEDLSAANKKKVTMKNILAAGVSEVQDAGRVTVYGNITVADLDYEKLIVSATFTKDGVSKTIESEHTGVYTTLRNNSKVVASVDAAIAGAAGQTAVEGTYLCGMTVKGIPAGEYEVAVTVYGLVPGVAGFTYNVCSETVVTTVTVA